MNSIQFSKILGKIAKEERKRFDPRLEFTISHKEKLLQISIEQYHLRKDTNRELLLDTVGADCSALATVFGAMAVIEHTERQPRVVALMDCVAFCHLVSLKARAIAAHQAKKTGRGAIFDSHFNVYPLTYAYCKLRRDRRLERSFEAIFRSIQFERVLFAQGSGCLGDMSLFHFIMGNENEVSSDPFRQMTARPNNEGIHALAAYHYRRCFYEAVTKGPAHEFEWTPYNYFPTEIWQAEERHSIRCSELGIPRMTIPHGDNDKCGINMPPIVVDLYDELVRDYGSDDNAR